MTVLIIENPEFDYDFLAGLDFCKIFNVTHNGELNVVQHENSRENKEKIIFKNKMKFSKIKLKMMQLIVKKSIVIEICKQKIKNTA